MSYFTAERERYLKMAKYEAMLVFRGDLDEKIAKSSLDELVKIIDAKNMKVESMGLKDLAYEIKYLKKGWYFLLNFETENQEAMNEFRRLSRINKNLLRQLIINLEKDYGYKASVNSKKVARNKKVAANYKRKQEELKNSLELKEKKFNK